MMSFVVAMMMSLSTRRDNRDSQDSEGNCSKKQRTQLHERTLFRDHSSERSIS
jgi:hypothetical protein